MSEENKKTEYITKSDLEEQTQIILTALDRRLTEVKDELKHDINNVQALIDGYVKAQEDFKQEFVIMKEEIKQMKKIIKDKLGLEVGAV